MTERWVPTDPRQREIHRLLLLVGGEPAAFFIDAAKLMDGDYRLEATTPVVAHLLRELNLSLREVLRPIQLLFFGGGISRVVHTTGRGFWAALGRNID
jgi:hypothetical protein